MTRNPLAKSLGLLRWMVESDLESVGVRSAAKALGLTPSSTHRLISALVEEGYLQKEEGGTGRYVLGIEMMLMSQRAASRWPLRNIAMAPMRAMTAECNESAYLNLFDPDRGENIGIASVETKQEVRYIVELQKWKPIHVGAAGHAVMAFLPEDERRRIIERTGLAPATSRSIVDPNALNAALNHVRSRGYAITLGQRIPGAIGIAAPIFCSRGRALGSVGISMPEQRFKPDMEDHLSRILLRCADEINARLGGRRPLPQERLVAAE
jgi:IclR family acetate operon transcriptional repressor